MEGLRDAGCEMRVAGCEMRVAGCGLRVVGHEMRALIVTPASAALAQHPTEGVPGVGPMQSGLAIRWGSRCRVRLENGIPSPQLTRESSRNPAPPQAPSQLDGVHKSCGSLLTAGGPLLSCQQLPEL